MIAFGVSLSLEPVSNILKRMVVPHFPDIIILANDQKSLWRKTEVIYTTNTCCDFAGYFLKGTQSLFESIGSKS